MKLFDAKGNLTYIAYVKDTTDKHKSMQRNLIINKLIKTPISNGYKL